MATIYEETPGSLTASPGRTVSTFPSGLVRVDQKYICTTATAATHRATLAVGNDMPDGNSAPTIDGLKIYPAPQESERGDGFTEFSVSAYGRTTREMVNIDLIKQNIIAESNSNSLVSFWEIKGKIAIPYGGSVEFEDVNLNPDLLFPFDAIYFGGAKTILSVTAGTSREVVTHSLSDAPKRRTLREYTIIFADDGATPSFSWLVYIEDPVFLIVGQQNFGSFVEVDVVTKRKNSESLTTI